MGPGAGGSRVVKSESGRLLRQWWNEPGDYLWVVDFFRLRGFMTSLLELSAAAAIAEGIRAAIEALEIPKATASIGIAVGAISDVSQFDAIYACADEAMYAAKRSGGNRIALGGATDATSPGRQKDEIRFRPSQLDDVLAADPLLSTDGP